MHSCISSLIVYHNAEAIAGRRCYSLKEDSPSHMSPATHMVDHRLLVVHKAIALALCCSGCNVDGLHSADGWVYATGNQSNSEQCEYGKCGFHVRCGLTCSQSEVGGSWVVSKWDGAYKGTVEFGDALSTALREAGRSGVADKPCPAVMAVRGRDRISALSRSQPGRSGWPMAPTPSRLHRHCSRRGPGAP